MNWDTLLGILALIAAFLAGVGMYECGRRFILKPIFRRLFGDDQ